MRLFIAVNITNDARARLTDAQRRLRQINATVNWVAPQNFHFTLKFLGESADHLLPNIKKAMDTVAAKVLRLRCELRGLGQFPRVIWAGLHGETEQLATLAKRLDEELGRLGFLRVAREFKPHLTLGRITFVGDKPGLTKAIDSLRNEPFGAMRVDAIHLFQSTLTARGSIYTKVHTAQLKGAEHGRQI